MGIKIEDEDEVIAVPLTVAAAVFDMLRKMGAPFEGVAIKDPVTRPATLMGKAGSAWLCEPWAPDTLAAPPVLVSWCLEIPGAHPAWHSYLILAYTLGPIEGVGPATIYLPGATHEFALMALAPDGDRNTLIAGEMPSKSTWSYLTPINFCAQMVCDSDDQARGIVEKTVVDMVEGRLNPDTDYIRDWIARFGDSMLKRRG